MVTYYRINSCLYSGVMLKLIYQREIQTLEFLGFLNYMYMVDASCIFSDLSMNNLTTIPDKAFLRYNQLVAL